MSTLLADNKLSELFGVAKLSKPYAYANISISSTFMCSIFVIV